MNTTMTSRIDNINKLLGGEEFKAVPIDSFKNNETREGIALQGNEMNASPIVYCNDEIWQKSDQEIVDYLKKYYEKYSLNVDINSLITREHILANVLPRVYSQSNIPELMQRGIAYVPMMDMVVAFYVPVERISDGHELASFNLTSQILQMTGLDHDELLQAASLHVEKDYRIQSLVDVVGGIIEDVCLVEENQMPPILVVSNSSAVNGAGVIISNVVLGTIAANLGTRYAILPSSIHELLCLPYDSDEDLQKLFCMVQNINATHVRPEDRLTDNVYVWNDGELKQFVS